MRPLMDMLLRFFAIAYGVSWAFWLPAAAAHLGWIAPVSSGLLHLAGGLGPMSSAILVTIVWSDKSAQRRLLWRGVQGGAWLAIGPLIPALLFVVSAGVLSIGQGQSIEWNAVGASTEFPNFPRPLYWLASVVCYGYGEELGWRGFALPRLQSRMSALRASFVLSVGWAAWHLPLFVFSPGLSNLGLGGIAGWFVSLALGSILLTWLFNASGGSVGAVALFHASLDVFITSPVSPSLANVMGALLTIGALGVIPLFGDEHLARRPRVIEPIGLLEGSHPVSAAR